MIRTASLLVTAATTEPITAADAMTHCRVDQASEATYILAIISAVRSFAEMQTGRALAGETRKLIASDWATAYLLDRSPVSAISTVKYYPYGYGAIATLASANYFLADGEPPSCVFKDTFSPLALATRDDAIEITYTTNPASIPVGLRSAMLLQIAHLYDQRSPVNIGNIVNELPFSFKALLESHRVGGFVA